MRQFLKKTLIYIVLICFVNAALIFVTYKIVNAVSYSLENKTIIVAGDSTTECAIDDTSTTECDVDGATLPPMQIVNISQSGTAMIYTYVKLRRFLQENNQIEKVILSISPSSLNDDKWVYSPETLNSKLPLYFGFMDNFDIKILSKDKLSPLYSGILKMPLSNLGVIVKTMMGSKCTFHDLKIGGFRNQSGSHIEPSDKQLHNFPFDAATQKGLIQKLYLDKIVDLCHIKNIKLYFITTPLYGCNGNENFSNYLKSTYTDVTYLNYSALKMPDQYFHDDMHLNGDGAKYFTPIFIKDINKSDI